jgi:hypothetical protein
MDDWLETEIERLLSAEAAPFHEGPVNVNA